MKIIDVEQGTPEWLEARRGKVTASRIGDLMAKTKSGWGASRANYKAQLIAERLTGRIAESYSNDAMRWGTATEPEARAAYEFARDVEVQQVGLVLHPTVEATSASPDGLVGDAGMIEIKCPNTSTHIETLLGAEIDGKYIKQMQWQMACAGRQWTDFISYDPRMPAEMQMHVRRVDRDDAMISEIEREVIAFLDEVDDTVSRLSSMYPTQQSKAA